MSGVRSRGAPSQPAEWGPSLQSQGDQGEGSLGWRCRDSAGSCVTWHHSRVMSSTLRRGAVTCSARLWPSSCSRGVRGAGSRAPVTVGPRGDSGALARTAMIGQHPGSQHLLQGLSSNDWAVSLRTKVAALGWWDRGVSVLLRLSHFEDRGGAGDSENGERRGAEATKPGAWRGRGWQESAVVLARAENFFRRIFCL